MKSRKWYRRRHKAAWRRQQAREAARQALGAPFVAALDCYVKACEQLAYMSHGFFAALDKAVAETAEAIKNSRA